MSFLIWLFSKAFSSSFFQQKVSFPEDFQGFCRISPGSVWIYLIHSKNRSDLLFTNAAILSLELIYLTEIKTLIFDTKVKIQFREFLTLLLSPKKIVEKYWGFKYSSGFFTKQIASQTGCHIKQVERKSNIFKA